MNHHPRTVAHYLTLMETLWLKNQPSLHRVGHSTSTSFLTASQGYLKLLLLKSRKGQWEKNLTSHQLWMKQSKPSNKCLAAKNQVRMAYLQKCREIPQDFKDAQIIHLYKNKGGRRLCDNQRGIPLLTNAGNIFARVIVTRLTTRLESTFSESQCNFRSGRGTTDMLFAARQVLEKCREQNLDLYMVFVEFTKPFDSVSREGLWKL